MTDTALRCPNKSCQKVLRDSGIELIVVAFPSDYEALKNLLVGNINRAKCPACEAVLTFDPVVCFLFSPTFGIWLYAPPVVRSKPGVVEATLRQMRQALATTSAGPETWKVELVDTVEELTGRARTVIKELFVDLFQGVLISRAKNQDEEWLQDNISYLDAAFFTGFQLVLDECLPIHFAVAASTAGAAPAATDILNELADIRTRLVTRACLQSLLTFSQIEEPVQDLLETLERTVPSCVLDERQVSALSDLAESVYADPDATAEVAYTFEAIVAWAALQIAQPNPRAQYWAGCVAHMEEYLARGSKEHSRMRLSDEFLKNTLDYHHLWNEIALRIRDETLGDIRGRAAAAQPLFNLAERLGLGDLIAELMPHMMRVRGLEKMQEEVFPVLFEEFVRRLDEDAGVPAYAEMVSRVIRAGKLQAALAAITLADSRLAPADRLADASIIRCRAAQAFNETHEYRTAQRMLMDWIERLKRSADWELLRLSTRIDVINELGNSFRYTGMLQKAIALYTDALDLCVDSSLRESRRTLLQNLGIAYRDSGRVLDGIRHIRESMQDEITPAKRSAALHSLALCHDLLGDYRQAVQYLEEALKLLKSDDSELFAFERMRLLISLTQNSARIEDSHRAFTAVSEALRLADEVLQSPFDSILCVVLMLKIGGDFVPQKTWESLATALGDQFLSLNRIPSAIEVSMILILAELALRLENDQQFEQLIALAETAPGEALARNRWRVGSLKSWTALRKGELPRAHAFLQESWRDLLVSFASADMADLPLTYQNDRELLQAVTSTVVPRLVEAGHATSTYLCLAAELQNSLMQNLSLIADKEARLKFLSRPLAQDWLEEDISFLVDSGSAGRPAAFLQFLPVGGGYRPLISQKQTGRPVEVCFEGSLDGHILSQAWLELRFAVELYNPAAAGDPVADLPNWGAVAGRLASAVRDRIRPGTHLCVVPTGELNHLPLHLARHPSDGRPLIADYTFSYVPSIFVAARLRERRLAAGRGPVWKPDRAGNFVVWLTDDDEDVVASFIAHSHGMRHLLESRGSIVVSAEGATATQDSFGTLLEDTQLLHICCHGIASLRGRTHRLLVSDGKSLPPSDLIALANPRNDAFFLDWDKISMRRAPAIVLSCACSSAVASVQAAGERVGFERSLFQGGTNSFVAPLWDIAVCDIHRLSEEVLRNYYSSPHMDLGQAVQKTILDCLAEGKRPHAAGALALMGDWL